MTRYTDVDKLEKHFIEDVSKHNLTINGNDYPAFLVDHTLHEIRNAPTADVVEVKHGEWVKYSTDLYGSNHKCSKCGNLADEDNSGHYAILTNYCSNCGAKMDGGKTE